MSKVVIAMLCIMVIEIVALLMGIDGALFTTVVAVLGGLGGYSAKVIKDSSKTS